MKRRRVYLQRGRFFWDNADGLEAIEWSRQELAPCVQGDRGARVFNKDRQWEGI